MQIFHAALGDSRLRVQSPLWTKRLRRTSQRSTPAIVRNVISAQAEIHLRCGKLQSCVDFQILGNKLVAAGFRHQQLGMRRVFLDLLAQTVDMRFQCVCCDTGIVAPHFL